MPGASVARFCAAGACASCCRASAVPSMIRRRTPTIYQPPAPSPSPVPSRLQQRLQRGERALPAEADHFIVAAPPHALLESGLRHAYPCRVRLALKHHLKRHRTDRIAVGRKPERVGDKKAFAGLALDHRPPEHAAKAAED